jgi:hypothetical protein
MLTDRQTDTQIDNCTYKLCTNAAFNSAITKYFDFVITGYSQKNGAVSKVNKKSISHLTRVKRKSATTTVQVSHVLPAVLNRA